MDLHALAPSEFSDTGVQTGDLHSKALQFLDAQGKSGFWYNVSLGDCKAEGIQVIRKLPGERGSMPIGIVRLDNDGNPEFVPDDQTVLDLRKKAMSAHVKMGILGTNVAPEQPLNATISFVSSTFGSRKP